MTDIERAKGLLCGNTIALARGDSIHTSNSRGIAPMLEYIEQGEDISGYAVADKVVGKAVAMLFIKASISAVYASVISQGAIDVLRRYNIPVIYDRCVEYIINRKGDGICPMESAVMDIYDIDIAYETLRAKLHELRREK